MIVFKASGNFDGNFIDNFLKHVLLSKDMRTVTAYEVYKALDATQGKAYSDIQRDAFVAAGLDSSKLQKLRSTGVLEQITGAAYSIMHGGATNPGKFYQLILELERKGLVKSEFEQPNPEGNPRRRVYWIAHPTHLSKEGFNRWLGLGE